MKQQIGLLALWMIAIAGGPATAQDIPAPNSVIAGQLDQGMQRCWLLPTALGSRWRLQLDGDTTYLEVGRGTCDRFQLDKSDFNGAVIDRITRIEFASGGGVYVVRGKGFFNQALPYQLPGEAEWEYAARAGSHTPWHTGSTILTDDADILNVFGKTVPVGSYPSNAFGLGDVHGNVSEWTLDCMDTGYIGVPNDGSAATSGDCATRRVVRGGRFDSEPGDVRSAGRSTQAQSGCGSGIGFRVTGAL